MCKETIGLLALAGLGLLLMVLCCVGTGCGAAQQLPAPEPKPGDPYTCTTDSGVVVKTYYGGPSCAETHSWIENSLVSYTTKVGFPCDLLDFHVDYVPKKITGYGTCVPWCWGVYFSETQRTEIYHSAENPLRTSQTLAHELAHHCLRQQSMFPNDGETNHCIMCVTEYLPCECNRAADCFNHLFPEEKENTEARRTEYCK